MLDIGFCIWDGALLTSTINDPTPAIVHPHRLHCPHQTTEWSNGPRLRTLLGVRVVPPDDGRLRPAAGGPLCNINRGVTDELCPCDDSRS